MEVYIDDFIQLAQTTDPNQLEHLSRVILHGSHSVFPPPSVAGHDGEGYDTPALANRREKASRAPSISCGTEG
jgi:hypothetical protein